MAFVDLKPYYRESDNSLIGYNRVTELEAIRNSILNMFFVSKGEVPGKPWYGNEIYSVLFDQMDQFTTLFLKAHIENQFEHYENRVIIVDIETKQELEFNRISLKIYYYIEINDEKIYDKIVIKNLNNMVTTRR